MATQKRRIVYLSDEEWEDIRKVAQAAGVSMSAWIRSRLVDPTPFAIREKAKEMQRHIDAIKFRPVPKPTQRKR